MSSIETIWWFKVIRGFYEQHPWAEPAVAMTYCS